MLPPKPGAVVLVQDRAEPLEAPSAVAAIPARRELHGAEQHEASAVLVVSEDFLVLKGSVLEAVQGSCAYEVCRRAPKLIAACVGLRVDAAVVPIKGAEHRLPLCLGGDVSEGLDGQRLCVHVEEVVLLAFFIDPIAEKALLFVPERVVERRDALLVQPAEALRQGGMTQPAGKVRITLEGLHREPVDDCIFPTEVDDVEPVVSVVRVRVPADPGGGSEAR